MTEHEFLHVKEFSMKRTYTATLPGSQQQTPARFIIVSEFTTGTWCNAIEASINYGTNGAAGGIGATISADMILPNKTFPSGAYYPLHLSFGAQASSDWNATLNPTAFIRFENWGTKTNFDDKGYLFHCEGLTEGTGNLYSAGAGALTTNGTLRINIGGTIHYIMLASGEAN